MIQNLTANQEVGEDYDEYNYRVEIAPIQLPGSMIMANINNNAGNNFYGATSFQSSHGEAILQARSETVEISSRVIILSTDIMIQIMLYNRQLKVM